MRAPELLASYWTICGAAEPHTDREYSPFSLRDRAASAARAGFTGLGIWHADLAHLRGKHSLPEMKRILDDHGIKHLELEFLTDWFVDGEKRKASDVTRRMLLESAAGLGARHIKVGDFFKTPVPMDKLIEEFASCAARRANTAPASCSSSCRSRASRSLPEMIELATGAAQPNGGICVDLWHVVKLGIPYEAVAAIPEALPDVDRAQRRLSQGAAGHGPGHRDHLPSRLLR